MAVELVSVSRKKSENFRTNINPKSRLKVKSADTFLVFKRGRSCNLSQDVLLFRMSQGGFRLQRDNQGSGVV